MTTDTFVVKPIRFPGGSIGELAVNGTVNDLAAAGARASALSVAIVLEEGLDADVLRGEVEAIAEAAAAPESRSSPATPRSSSADTPTRCTSARPGSAGSMSGRRSRPARWPPAIACWSRSRWASTARRSCSRGRARPRCRCRLRHALAVASRGRPARLGRAGCGACATRPAVASRRS